MQYGKIQPVCFNTFLLICYSIFLFSTYVSYADASPSEDEEKYQRVLNMYSKYKEDFPEVRDIPAEDALLLMNNPKTVFVDVRKKKEQEISTIPGAITQKQFLADLDRYSQMNIVAYCTISYRSGKLAEKMAKKGVTIINLQAGLLGWVHAGGPLVDGNLQVKKLHVYGKKWDLAPDGIHTMY